MLRFVLLYHECPPGYVRTSHWDLMLEEGDALRTWALAQLPRSWDAAWAKTAESAADCPAISSDDSVAAEQLADHRLVYLHEEGPLSGDRGAVRRIDGGTYESDLGKSGEVAIVLQGEWIRGRVTLRCGTSLRWMLVTD